MEYKVYKVIKLHIKFPQHPELLKRYIYIYHYYIYIYIYTVYIYCICVCVCVCVCVCIHIYLYVNVWCWWLSTPVVELIGVDESLRVGQWCVFTLVPKKIPQLQGGEYTPITRIMPEHRVQLRPAHQLTTELLYLHVIQPAITRAITLLQTRGGIKEREIAWGFI